MAPDTLDIETVRQLAIDAGFVFDGTDAECSNAKKANLGAFFDSCGVNSLSSFRNRFSTVASFEEHVHGSQAGTSHRPAERPNDLSKDKAPSEAASSIWHSIPGPTESFYGNMVGERREGLGVLVFKAGRSQAKFEGQFSGGLRNGMGVITSSTGEIYCGPVKDDLMFGPGVFDFAQGGGVGAVSSTTRVQFIGIFNGMPRGKGMFRMADGSEEFGEFEGTKLLKSLPEDECEGVLVVAQANAAEARRIQKQIQNHILERQLQIPDL